MSKLPFDDEPTPAVPRVPEVPKVPGGATAPVTPASPYTFAQARPERDAAPAAASRRVLTVSELSATIRDALESKFQNIWVEGEISNARLWNTGHLYFTLKDSASQIKAVIFRGSLRYLKFKPEDGLRVVARGKISVYDVKGEYQLICEHLEPQGFGPLQVAFEQLKKKLAAEGLFEASRKRPLPALPRRIGLVTSIDGAALRDMVRVLRRRYPNAHLIIAPTRVQGEGAAGEVARALKLVARVPHVDVIIVGRGGGSLEDLWAFNEEAVARAIAASPVPVISGVGHETDVTIADFVADLRAATPSAAAELVVRRKDEFFAHIDRIGERLDAAMGNRLRRMESRLHQLEARPGYSGFPGRLAFRGRHVSELTSALRHGVGQSLARRARRHDLLRRSLDQFDPRHRLGAIRTRLVSRDAQLAAARRRMTLSQGRFGGLAARLEGLSPLAVLGRGYAVTWDAARTRIIRDASTVQPGDQIRVTLDRGGFEASVTNVTVDE
ncbi:MAG: exodeoxyribonuclease VII large subunit [Acidobacteriota bacterium]|nr:exodeoxyribonuclease VII large subunit [Acidobacteriota bacterium]